MDGCDGGAEGRGGAELRGADQAALELVAVQVAGLHLAVSERGHVRRQVDVKLSCENGVVTRIGIDLPDPLADHYPLQQRSTELVLDPQAEVGRAAVPGLTPAVLDRVQPLEAQLGHQARYRLHPRDR